MTRTKYYPDIMKKNILLISVSLLVIAAFGGYYLINFNQNKRQAYEKAILEKARLLPQAPKEKKKGVKSPDQPDMAAFQEYIMTMDPETGLVPKKSLYPSYLASMAMERNKSAGEYTPPVEWEGTQAMMGGRTRMIMFDPNDPTHEKVWAGGVTGGLWFNYEISDVSSWWEPVDDFWSSLAISSMAYDPNNTETFYVGTGEAQTARTIYRESSGVGVGIFKSTDAGETWELLPSTDQFDYITDIAVRDENGTSVVYACVASGFYHGEDFQSHPSDGLYRSTNGGDTWTQVLPDIAGSPGKPYAPSDIEIGPDGRIFIGTMENLELKGGATILYSDSGLPDSWTVYGDYNVTISNEAQYNIPARTIVAVSPSNPDRVYAQFAAGYTNGFIYYRGRYMVKSLDGGSSWEWVNPPADDWSTLAWHAFVLQVDPINPEIVYTGGLDLWRSANGGEIWKHISDWSLMYYGGGDDYVHADQHNIQFQPGSYTKALFSTDGGIFLTNTANYSSPVFIERSQGYNTLQFYSCAIHPLANFTQYIGGLQDNGTLKYNGSPLDINDMIDGGDGAFCFWDEDSPNVYITSVYYNSYSTWRNNNKVGYFGGGSGTFISPADYNSYTNTLYSNATDFFGGYANKLLRATGIPNELSSQIIDIGTSSSVAFSAVTSSKYSPEGTTNLFVGTQAGLLYKIINANDIPQAVEIGSTSFPTANISCIALGASEDVLLVTFSNYGVSSVWLTMDGGATWQEKETNLPDMPIRWALFHPENEGQVMLATELGIWATNTLTEPETEWSPANLGMGNVRVDMLKLRAADKVVLAASHGRGLFTAPYEKDLYVSINEFQSHQSILTLYPNPASTDVTLKWPSNRQTTAIIRVTNLSGKTTFQEQIQVSELNTQLTIDVTGYSQGTYLVSLTLENKVVTEKLVIN